VHSGLRILEHFWNTSFQRTGSPTSGFCSIADVCLISARPLSPPVEISKRRLRQPEAIQLIREQRDTGHEELGFNAMPFVLCGIPLRRSPKEQLTLHHWFKPSESNSVTPGVDDCYMRQIRAE
jgi:hypothetical protein